MQKVKGIKLACLAAFAILPVQAYALGVGKLTMHSALDEPLNASIELTAVTKTELQSLEIRLGSVGVFNMAGVDRNEMLKSISFTVARENGKDVIRMRTDQPFRDPFLHFIINATWANGSMLREYTALLDPPSYLTGQAASIKAPTVAAPVVVTSPTPAKSSAARPSARRAALKSETSMQTTESSPAVAPMPSAGADTPKLGPKGIQPSTGSSYSDLRPGGAYGPVKKGDALWNIAEDVKAGTQLGIAQVIMAIYKQNPDAFLRNNINLIRVGKTLQIPSDSEISSTSRSVAQVELQEQMDEWQAYRDGFSSGSQTAKISYGDVTKGSDTSDSKAADSNETTAGDGTEGQSGRLDQADDVLEIIRADVNKSDTTGTGSSLSDEDRSKFKNEISAYKQNLGLLEESLASSELEKKELSERVLLLEQQIDKANKLIDMQSTELAKIQGKAATEKTADDYMKSMEKVAEAPVKPIMPAEMESSKLSAPDISPIAPAKTVVKKPPVAKKPVAEKKAKKTRVKPKPAEQKGMMDTAMDFVTSSWMTMLGAVLAIVLVLVGLFVVFRRRRSIAEFEDSIISGTAVLDISTTESTEPLDAGSETSFLSDFVPGMGNMQADEVDPLAEAEVYMAYGRDEQAEEVLKEAASKTPDRHELKLKLLEIYQGRKDVSSFETLAEELYPADGNIPAEVWARVAEMGKIINPENPLFQGELSIQSDTLFGDKERKKDAQLSDLLDTGSISTEEADLMDVLNEDIEGDTEEIFSDSEESNDMETMENFELDDDTKDDLQLTDTGKERGKSGDDFPVPDEEVLDLDLGDFKPDEEHETDSFNLDSLAADMNELEGDTDENDAIDVGEIDFNLDGIDLDLGEAGEEDTIDPALAATMDMSDLEGLEGLDLDLGSEESDDTAETAIQDETLEFADLGDLTLPDTEIGSADESNEPADDSPSELPPGANETWDEAGTKLDLAMAYIEMDDNESAQSILEEVAKEGTDSQKDEARDLINKIIAG